MGAKKKILKLYTKQKILITIPKRLKKKISYKIRYESPLFAPLTKDKSAGELIIKNNNETLKSYKLYINQKVDKLNFFSKILLNFKILLFGESLIAK